MTRPSTRSQSLVLGLTWVIACTDDVPSGDEVVEDESTSSESTDDDVDGSSTGTSTEDESSDDVDGSETVDTDPETDTSSESESSESESESSSSESESSDTDSESSSSESDSSSSSEEESSSDGMMDTDTGGELECGNGMQEVTEACDDGNDLDGDGCEADCTFTVNIDWVVVHEAINPMECSSVMQMAFRADGDVATTGISKENGDYKLHVATWDAENGDVLAEHFGDSLVNSGPTPTLDTLPDGDLLVAFTTAELDPNNTIGTAWRFGPDLELEWMKTAAELGVLDTLRFEGVLGKPDGGMLLLSANPYINDFDAQGQFLGSKHVGMGTFDIGWVGDTVGAVGASNIMNMFTGIVRVFDLPGLGMVNETFLELNQGNNEWHPWQLEHRGDHIAAVGTHPYPTVWRLDDTGDLIATHEITQVGNLATYEPGLGIANDGSVAVTTLGVAMGIDLDGTLLWHLPDDAIDSGLYFRDALIDDQGRVYIGGYDASDLGCWEAVLIRISW